ncbi:MAG: hypothetical protein A2Y15_02865 [Clostridiales bacterium GWF2_36_10]|nr:MAG: hypothetical protein A2Y15_02865 [Clostridiales bacterium GWF2_36_10]HAN20915.1 hypothetical protein [Clostridiales bacterium]
MKLGLLIKNKKNRSKLLLVLLLAFSFVATAAALTKNSNKNTDTIEVFYPIKAISTEENIYTLTAVLTGDEKEEDIKMLLSVCEGLGIKITYFAEADWIDDNEELAIKIGKNGILGLRISKDLSGRRRNFVMEYIADRNDEFFEKSGKYAKYVRVENTPDQTLTQVLNAYGQYCISFESALTKGSTGTITKGKIIDIGYIDENTAYTLAQAVGEAIKNSLTCIEMEKFLYEIGSDTDEYGTQYT